MSERAVRRTVIGAGLLLAALLPAAAWAQSGPTPPSLPLVVGQGAGGTSYSVPIQTLLFFTALSFLPAVLLMMTGFTRIVIVLSLMRQALGTQAAPPNQVVVGLSLFLTFFVMSPTIDKVYEQAWVPYSANQIAFDEALKRGEAPMRTFMLKQTRQADVELFAKLAKLDPSVKGEKVPFMVLVPAFVTSELKTAFQIGFLIFVPFLIIDMIVASVLMSLGMMMLSPVLVALPFKLMLFVLADGWNLLMLLTVSAPMLVVILVVGVLVSIFQAATQINEATLSFVPKLLAAVGVCAVAGPWMMQTLVDYLRNMLLAIPQAAG